MGLFDKCYQFTEAKKVIEAGYYPFFIPLDETEGSEAILRGKRIIMVGSNNYLGLTTHPKVRDAAIQAIRKYGTSCTGSRFLNGTLQLHEQLEDRLAKYLRKEASLCFSTGFQTNLGVIATITGKGDAVILDKDDHACLYDGVRLSSAILKRYQHNNMADLERTLSSLSGNNGRLVAVDGVFSMEGDLAPLPEIVQLCKKYDAKLLVDDAHSIGVMGGGRGTAAHFDVEDDTDLIVGTFSKSFASLGGFVAGNEQIIHYIKHHARTLIFSASIPAANAAAAMAALDVMESEPDRIKKLHRNAKKMRKEFKSMGFNTGKSQTPVVPIIIGSDRDKTLTISHALLNEGVFVNPVFAPAVPPQRSLLRTSYMATHTDEQLDRVLEIFYKVGKRFGLI
ncbi:MAG: 8-amino-7-oxononanoate synthase [Candidatus Cloacimonetes bacterium 4572_55]|nr:MAG: 8-amino-7-oxononanoate synthase [Candidatus Cloacimonetes bacterium 4572_55]